jgi:hypothetical protein
MTKEVPSDRVDVGFVMILTSNRLRGTGKCAERAADRSDQEAATVDHQSLAGHEGLSH